MAQILNNNLSSNAHWLVNKDLAKHLGENDAALLLADLISKRSYFESRNELKDGGFSSRTEDLENDLNLTRKRRIKMTQLLVTKGLLVVKRFGLPSKNYYFINDEAVTNVFKTLGDLI